MQIVFGIARRVPPPNTPKHPSNIENVSDSAKQIPHTTMDSIIFHESNPLTTFCSVTSRHRLVIVRTVFSLSLHISRRGFIGTSYQSKDHVPLSRDSH